MDNNSSPLAVKTPLTPVAGTAISGSTNNIITFTLECLDTADPDVPILINAVNTTTNPIRVQLFNELGDTAQLLGGDRVSGLPGATAALTTADVSIKISIVQNSLGTTPGDPPPVGGGGGDPLGSAIRFECLYPAIRATTPNIYVRSSNLSSTSWSSGKLQSKDNDSYYVVASDILAIIPVNTEYCKYSGDEWYIDIYEDGVSKIHLYVTDEYNRPLGRTENSASKTATTGSAAGSAQGLAQSTLGNLNFTASIRFDVIQPPRSSDAQQGVARLRF